MSIVETDDNKICDECNNPDNFTICDNCDYAYCMRHDPFNHLEGGNYCD